MVWQREREVQIALEQLLAAQTNGGQPIEAWRCTAIDLVLPGIWIECKPFPFLHKRGAAGGSMSVMQARLLSIYIEHFDGLSFIVGSSNGEELALFSWPSFECVATGDNPTVCYLVEQTKGKKVVFPDGLDVELRRKGWRPPHPPLRIS